MSFTQFPINTVASSLTGTQAVARLEGASTVKQTLANAVELAELGGISVGDTVVVLDTLSTYQLKDGVSSRPSEIEGYILHVSGSFQYLENVFFEREVFPWERSGTGVQLALQVSRETGRPLKLVHGAYTIPTTLVLQTGDSLFIDGTARLEAQEGFSGSSLIDVGTTTQIADHVSISGKGRINAVGRCNRTLNVVYSRFSTISGVRIDGGLARAISLGSNAAEGKCYEVNINEVSAMYPQQLNTSNSVAVFYERATDCYLSDSIFVGYRQGVLVGASSFSIEASLCHVWAREVHGALTKCYAVFGDATFSQCNADTPFDLIGGLGELHGFFLSGTTIGSMLRVFANADIGTDEQVDNRIVPFFFDGNTDSVITVGRVHGGSPTRRFKSFEGGDLVNNQVVTKITGPSANYVTAP